MKSFERVIDAFRAHGLAVVEKGRGRAVAQGPGHSKKDRSVSIAHNDVDMTWVHSFAGQAVEEVLEGVGLATRDLYDDPKGSRYEYPDGRVSHRTPQKRFRQSGNTKGTSLFRVEEIMQAIRDGETVYVVEGEKDVRFVESAGGTATCSAMGASNACKADWSPLKGGNVVIVADKDEAGTRYAHAVADILVNEVGVSGVRMVRAKAGKDAADHIAAGCSLEEFEPFELPALAKDAQKPDRGTKERARRRAKLTWADQIEPEAVVWAWADDGEGRIPAGALCVAAGREGTGKSSFGIWLAAQVTRGELDGAWRGEPRKVLYLAVEDSWKHTLVPRLLASGADRTKVGRLEVVREDDEEVEMSLPVDNALLEEVITAEGIGLVVLDPLMSFLSARIDTHRTHEVRTALDPLAKIAERTGAVILGIAHFNKSSGADPASMITGAGAFKDVPRAVFGFAKDTETGERVITQVKNTSNRDDLPSLAYRIAPATIETKHGPANTSRFELDGNSERTVLEMMRAANRPDEGGEDKNEARAFINHYLIENGGEADVADVFKAGRACGFKDDQLKNARARCKKPKITSRKASFGDGWVWAFADESPQGVTKKSKASPIQDVTPSTSSATPSPDTAAPVADPAARICPECGQPAPTNTAMHLGCVLKRNQAEAEEPDTDCVASGDAGRNVCQKCPRELVHPISIAKGLCTIHHPINEQAMADYYKAQRETNGIAAS